MSEKYLLGTVLISTEGEVWKEAEKRAKKLGYLSLWSLPRPTRNKFLEEAYD